MKLAQKFNLRSMKPLEGGESGFWISIQAAEVAAAITAGTGPGVADDTGTIQAGTVKPGHFIYLTSNSTADFLPSVDLTAAAAAKRAITPFVVFAGDDDFSGSLVGELLAVHGPGRFDTEQFDAGTYAPHDPLVASASNAGNLGPKTTGDHKQVIAEVGPRGVVNGVMDVIFVQGVNSQDY